MIEVGGLLSKDNEDIFRGITGLKPGKERVLGEVLFSLTVVFFQSSIENGGKVGMGGRCGGHGETGTERTGREGRTIGSVMSGCYERANR